MVPGISLKLQTRGKTEPLGDFGKDKELQSELCSSSYLGQHLEHGPKESRELDSLSQPHMVLNV